SRRLFGRGEGAVGIQPISMTIDGEGWSRREEFNLRRPHTTRLPRRSAGVFLPLQRLRPTRVGESRSFANNAGVREVGHCQGRQRFSLSSLKFSCLLVRGGT